MKKINLILLAIFLVSTSSFVFAAAGGSGNGSSSGAGGGYGGGSVQPGPEFTTPRGFGEEASQDDTEAHERKFNEAAPGAWSKDPEPGKDKPSSDK